MGMHSEVHAALRTLITTAWPEITGSAHPIFRVTQVERFPWMERIKSGALAPPWVVYQMETAQERTGMGASLRAYESRLTVYYITRYGEDGEGDIAGFVEEKLEALAAEFFAQSAWPGFQHIAGSDVYDVTAENPANRVFIAGHMNWFGGSLSVPILFGAATSPDYTTPEACGDE